MRTAFENSSRLLPKKKLCATRTHGSKLVRCHSNILQKYFQDVSREFDDFRVITHFFKLLVGACNILCGLVFS